MSGIEKIPIRWPDRYDPEFFQRLFREVLALADARNAQAGTGIQITGNPDGPATISGSEVLEALVNGALVLAEPESALENSRVLAGSTSIEIVDNGPGDTLVIRLASEIPLNRLAPIAGLSILGSPAEGDDLEIEPIESSSDHTVLRRVPDTDPESENDSTLDWGPLTLEMAPSNLWTYTKLQQATALSVLGRSSNSQGNLGDIVAGSDHAVLRRSGSSIGFGTAQVAGGGTGRTSVTSGALLLGNGTGALSPLSGSTLGDLPYWNGLEFVARSIGTKRVKEVAFSDPLVLDFSDADAIFVELTGDAEIQLTGAVSGQRVVVLLKQDGTGSRTLDWGDDIRFSDDVPEPTLSTDPTITDRIHFHFDEDGEGQYDAVLVSRGYPEPAAELSALAFYPAGSGAATIEYQVNDATGTAYVVVTDSDTEPSIAQIKAGQDHTGSAATFADSDAALSLGLNEFDATGLTGGPYWAYLVQETGAGADTNILSGEIGSESDPFLISDSDELDAVRHWLDREFRMIADIDLTSWGTWTPIGDQFIGVFDGFGHVISNLDIDSDDRAGLFKNVGGTVGAGGIVRRLGLESVSITPNSANYQGSLTGACNHSDTLIEDCYVFATIGSGGDRKGGLIGAAADGQGVPIIRRCYSVTSIPDEPSSLVGAFLAQQNDSGSVLDSYYDSDVSDIEGNGSTAVGKTTAEMQQEATFTGWDFENTWQIDEGNDYPRLRVQS